MKVSGKTIINIGLKKLALHTALLLCITDVYAQTAICPADIPSTTDSAEFTELEDGNMLHTPSNLVFMRCALGQTYNGSTCTGSPIAYTWQQALAISVQTNAQINAQINSQSNSQVNSYLPSWRVPNIKELALITERACVRPAINETVFPNTAPDGFWTSTPSVRTTDMAWSITFTNGSQSVLPTNRSLFVRLVRNSLVSELP